MKKVWTKTMELLGLKKKSLIAKEPDDLWCYYSDLPSPQAYADCTDYDSMGDCTRFPGKTVKKKNKWIKKSS